MKDKPKQEKTYSVSSSTRGRQAAGFDTPALKLPAVRMPKGRGGSRLLATLAVAAIAIVSGFTGGWVESHTQNGVVSGNLSGQKKIITTQSQLISQIAKTVGPSVVSVNVSITGDASGQAGFGLFGFAQPEQEQAAGTGIIIGKNIIVTNRHVVPDGTTSVSVTLSDGTELKDVSIIGRTGNSDSLDVAFLKVNDVKGHKLVPAVIGDSSTVQVGDDAVAIGNALGQFQNTVTSGIISGYGRSVQAGSSSGNSSSENLVDLFQTDAAINQGNSGGPLVNLNGQVIGINTATAGNAQNIGFAIPVNDVKGLMKQVVSTGKFSRPYLGIAYIPLTADVADEYSLNVQNGAFIAPSSDPASPSVSSGSPADKAGLKEGDIVTAIDDTDIDQTHSLTGLISQHQPGDKVDLTVLRDGHTRHVTVTLGTAPTG